MKTSLPIIFCFVSLFSCAFSTTKYRVLSSDDYELQEKLSMTYIRPINLSLRSGYFLERNRLNACILYLQGLGDSIRNHNPYFKALTYNGYRVITFDYMGQGKSEGSMNKTRLKSLISSDNGKYYEIGQQAQLIWEKYSQVKNIHGEDCLHSKKIVIGWSTGGLAAYRMARDFQANAVVLIAPGIHTKIFIGESEDNIKDMVLLRQVITERTLTRNKFKNKTNPHIDPVYPKSPAHVPLFSMNLFLTSKKSQHWKVNQQIPGLVFLSGKEDSYIDREKTKKTLQENNPHFEIISYDGALHELDNELEEVSQDLYSRTIDFLNSISQ